MYCNKLSCIYLKLEQVKNLKPKQAFLDLKGLVLLQINNFNLSHNTILYINLGDL